MPIFSPCIASLNLRPSHNASFFIENATTSRQVLFSPERIPAVAALAPANQAPGNIQPKQTANHAPRYSRWPGVLSLCASGWRRPVAAGRSVGEVRNSLIGFAAARISRGRSVRTSLILVWKKSLYTYVGVRES